MTASKSSQYFTTEINNNSIENESISDTSDEEDELSTLVIERQKQYSNECDAPNSSAYSISVTPSEIHTDIEKCIENNTSAILSCKNDTKNIVDNSLLNGQLSTKHVHTILPSVSEAFSSITVELTKHQPHTSRVTYSAPPNHKIRGSSESTSNVKDESTAVSARSFGLPEVGTWHVPLTFIDALAGKKQKTLDDSRHATKIDEKRLREAEFVRKRGNSVMDLKKKSDTVKDREKLKRQKGQSSHNSWKPETWMKLRQQYD